MGSGGVAIAALPTVICFKVTFSDGLGGVNVNSANTRKVPIILVFCCTVFFKIGDSKKMVKREMTNQR